MYKYFTPDEFKCICCDVNKTDPFLIEMLDVARNLANMPFVITSGYRCAAHNALVGGKSNSAHIAGKAADIAIPNMQARLLIVHTLLNVGFTRIEIAPFHIHVDIDTTKPQGMF